MAQELEAELSQRIKRRSEMFSDANELEHVLSRNILKLVHESQHHETHTRALPISWQRHLQADRPTKAFNIMGMKLGDQISDAQVWVSKLASLMPQVTTLDRHPGNPQERDLPYYMQTQAARIKHIQGYKDAMNLVLANHQLRNFHKHGSDYDSNFYADPRDVLVNVAKNEQKVALSKLTEKVYNFFHHRQSRAKTKKIISEIPQDLPQRGLRWARVYRQKARAQKRKQPYKRAPDGHSRASTREQSISPSPETPRVLRSDPDSRHYRDRATLAPSMERASWETKGDFRRDRSVSRSQPREMPDDESDKRAAAGIESGYEDDYPAKAAEMGDYDDRGYAAGYDTDVSRAGYDTDVSRVKVRHPSSRPCQTTTTHSRNRPRRTTHLLSPYSPAPALSQTLPLRPRSTPQR